MRCLLVSEHKSESSQHFNSQNQQVRMLTILMLIIQFIMLLFKSCINVAFRIPKKPMYLGQSTLLSSSVVSQPLFPTKLASKSSTPILGSRLKTAQIQIIGSSWTDTWSELLWTDPVDMFLQMCAGDKNVPPTSDKE